MEALEAKRATELYPAQLEAESLFHEVEMQGLILSGIIPEPTE
jgi:hypothetical protein